MDPYLSNCQEIRSGVLAAKSPRIGDLGFQNRREKWRKSRGETHLLGEELDPQHLQQIERERGGMH